MSAEPRSSDLASMPAPGTLEWALAVEIARREALKEPETVDALISRYRRLLDLYRGCTGCRAGAYDLLKDSLRHYFNDQKAIDRIEEEEFAGNPVELAKLLVRTGQTAEATRVARQGLERVRLVERRAELQNVLAQVHFLRGETRKREALLRHMAAETALIPDSCPISPDDSSETERLFALLDASSFRRQLEQLRDMQREQEGSPAFACLYNWLLISARSLVGRRPGGEAAALSADDIASLFPEGIETAQRRLAEAVSDRKIRAAILLSASDGKLRDPPDRDSALELLAEAEAASSSSQVRVAVLRLRLRALWHRPDEARRVAGRLTAEFPQYYAACETCEHPANFDGAPRWIAACGKLTAECFEPARAWKQEVFEVPRGSGAELEALLHGHPPEEVVPLILLRLSDEVRDAEPDRARELEQRAIHHPEFPALSLDQRERESRAAQRGDFETALFLALASPSRNFGSCIPEEKVFRDRDFRNAYYKVRLGIDPSGQWQVLLDLLSDGPPNLERASFFYRTEILDLLVQAARAAHNEPEAAAWLEALRRRYQQAQSQAVASPFRTDDTSSPAHALRKMELMLSGYIRELEAPR